jgi:hypothetical protein
MLKELLRGVIYYIKDAKTYYNFALVSKYCSELAREYRSYKMDEFSSIFTIYDQNSWIYGNKDNYVTYKVLPSGKVNGFVYLPDINNYIILNRYKNGILTDHIDYKYYHGGGAIKPYWSYFGNDINQLKNIDHLIVTYVTTNYKCQVNRNGYVDINIGSSNAYSTKCATCNQYHYFHLYPDKEVDFSMIIILRTCSERKYTIVGKKGYRDNEVDEYENFEDEKFFHKVFVMKKLFNRYRSSN